MKSAIKVSQKPKGQAALPLWENLKKLYPDVQCEARFEWLRLPIADDADVIEATVRSELIRHNVRVQSKPLHPKKQCCTPELLTERLLNPRRPKLEFDFFIPSLALAIEFDERQHFTEERGVSLLCYADRIALGFDSSAWLNYCLEIQANDTDPPCRDWERAYRDAIRDIKSHSNGIKLVRFCYKKIPSIKELRELL